MLKYYSIFWLDYCAGKVKLNSEFTERDEESPLGNEYNIRGRVRTGPTNKYIAYQNQAIAGIEGKPVC